MLPRPSMQLKMGWLGAYIATTSIYLLSDEAKRSRQMDEAFAAP